MWYTLHRKMRASLEVDAHGGEGRFGLEVERHVRVGRVLVFGWNGYLMLFSRL